MTVGLVIVSHSAQLAAGIAELAGQMAQGKTPIAAAGGAADNVLGTSVDKILDAMQSVDNADGVLVLLDLGSALLSAEMALEMLPDEQRARTRLSYAPLVEGAFAAALEASVGCTLAEVTRAAENTASAEQLLQLKPLSQDEAGGTSYASYAIAITLRERPGNYAAPDQSGGLARASGQPLCANSGAVFSEGAGAGAGQRAAGRWRQHPGHPLAGRAKWRCHHLAGAGRRCRSRPGRVA